MIITKHFILINYPKSGSTFTRKVLKKLYGVDKRSMLSKVLIKLKVINPHFKELILPNIRISNRQADQHGTYAQIPKGYLKDRVVISVMRNPYSRFLSIYKFKAWANPNQLAARESVIKKKLPNFPNLSIDEFCELSKLEEQTRLFEIFNKEIPNANNLGNLTIHFIQLFFKDPSIAIDKMSDHYIDSGEYKNDMGKIKFLKQESLNAELIQFLTSYGFTSKQLEFIHTFNKLNTTNYNTKDKNSLWTPKAIEYVKYRERFLLKLLKDLGLQYEVPTLE